ncbi:MAG: MarR family winged helix-turn-helix transcriptional regulator [Caulobacteraceae bacterium]
MSDLAPQHETAADPHERTALRFWFRTYAAVAEMEHAISARLRERFSCSLGRFDLMAHLFAAPSGLTMGELSRRLLVSGGNVTGLVERLSREGLAAREVDGGDRRVYRVSLTAKGRAQFIEMAGEHEAWVAELTGGLEPGAMAQAADLMEAWRRRLAASRG